MRPGNSVRLVMILVSLAMLSWVAGTAGSALSPPTSSDRGKAGDPGKETPTTSSIVARDDKQQPSDLVVHEWGTFLGMSGSDGAAMDGMYHEEHALPSFVHSRARDQLRLPGMFLKGETPVIYFYTQRAQQVRVGVGFPQGIWTQWYPQAALVLPPLLQHAESPDRLTGGRICWYAEVIPASEALKKVITQERGATPRTAFELPATSSDALWNHAREVDAAFVKTIDDARDPARAEYERFLFYRGLGEARLPMRIEAGHGGTLALDREPTLGDGVRHVFVLRVENGRGVYRYRPTLRPGERVTGVIPPMDKSLPLSDFTRAVADDLAAKLTEAGLFPKEARAMVNTWKTSYFQTDGVRVLFALPQSWTDAFIPMKIVPPPKQVVRLMVGRMELLTADRERLAEAAVHDLAAADPGQRQRAFRFLHEQGRYVEPIVRRVEKTTQDAGVRTLCRRLLQTEFVTELRAAIHNASDGKRLNTDPVVLRAQLGRLLRDIGLAEEARIEGVSVWSALRSRPAPGDRPQADDAGTLEIQAAALEATGHDRRAAEVYARRIDRQVNLLKGDVDPSLVTYLREWWVGRAYAKCAVRSGEADATIARLEARLRHSSPRTPGDGDDRAARVYLALLLGEQGKTAMAEVHWSSLSTKAGIKAVVLPPSPATDVAGGASS